MSMGYCCFRFACWVFIYLFIYCIGVRGCNSARWRGITALFVQEVVLLTSRATGGLCGPPHPATQGGVKPLVYCQHHVPMTLRRSASHTLGLVNPQTSNPAR